MRGGTGSANGLRAAARRPRSGRLARFLAALDAALEAGADQLEAELERIRCAFVYPSRLECCGAYEDLLGPDVTVAKHLADHRTVEADARTPRGRK